MHQQEQNKAHSGLWRPAVPVCQPIRRVGVAFGRQVLDSGNDPGSRRGVIAALLLLAAMVAGGVWLTGALRNAGRIQDCVQQGRSNCAPITAG